MFRPDPASGGGVDMVRLVPGCPVRLAGTGLEVRWDGERELAVYRRGGIWDLSPAVRIGRVLAWTRLVKHPHLGWWPILPMGSRATYRANSPFPVTGPERARVRRSPGAQTRWAPGSRARVRSTSRGGGDQGRCGG
jgi:hypothetical protein